MNSKKLLKNEKGVSIVAIIIIVLIVLSVIIGGVVAVVTINSNNNETENGSGISGSNNNKNNTVAEKGTYDKPYIPKGFTHIEGTWDTGYVIKETETGSEFVWVPCVLDQSEVKSDDKVVTFEKVTKGDYNSGGIYIRPTWNEVKEDDETAEELKKSVGNFQGFYIARYEAGINSDVPNSKLAKKTVTDESVKPISKAGVGVWNGISRETALKLSKCMVNTSDGVKSTLISGEAWDTTLQWIKLSDENYDTSAERGNYTGTFLSTGSDKKYSANNIYDLAGNYEEYTTENARVGNRGKDQPVVRGNSATTKNDNSKKAAMRDNFGYDVSYDIATFRVVLYK